jgi:hypothetical protein
MKTKYIALAGATLVALSAGVAYADEQDEKVRQLNLEQLAKARGQQTDQAAPAPIVPDGQGGPEYQSPPSPDEGMTDEPSTGDEMSDEPPATDEENAPPDGDQDGTKPVAPPI